jgi:hypothetical protein
MLAFGSHQVVVTLNVVCIMVDGSSGSGIEPEIIKRSRTMGYLRIGMLWTLLTVMSSGTIFIGALIGAKDAQARFGGFAIAVIVGLLQACFNTWMLYRISDAIAYRSSRYSQSAQEWCFRVLYAAAALLVPVATFFGNRIGTLAIR